jgi:hypothetical protein
MVLGQRANWRVNRRCPVDGCSAHGPARFTPQQVFIGNLTPEALAHYPRPWTDHPVENPQPVGPFGRIVDQAAVYGLMKLSDDFDLVVLREDIAQSAQAALRSFGQARFGDRLGKITGVRAEQLRQIAETDSGLPLFHEGRLAGFVRSAHDQDTSLGATFCPKPACRRPRPRRRR